MAYENTEQDRFFADHVMSHAARQISSRADGNRASDLITSLADRSLWFAVGTLIAVVLLFEWTPLDLAIQDQFYDAVHSRWLVDAGDLAVRAIFHVLPTAITIAIGIALLVSLLAPCAGKRFSGGSAGSRRAKLCALLTLISVPVVIATGKRFTNIFCPWDIRRYGGDVCYVRLFEQFPDNDTPKRRGHCFPAAHASGGFSLIGLAGLTRRRRAQLAAILFSFVLGWISGGYQMLTGAHYFGDTVVTMLLVWIVFSLWRRALRLSGGVSATDSKGRRARDLNAAPVCVPRPRQELS